MSRFRGYSPSHDKGQGKEEPKKAKKAKESAPPTSVLLPRVLSDEERVALRARQLLSETDGGREALLRDKSLDVPRPHSLSENLIDGKTVNPLVKGKHVDREPILLENDPDMMGDPDMVLGRIAAISVTDEAIQRFDNIMSQTTSSIKTLRQSAQQLLNYVRQSQGSPQAIEAATQIDMIVAKVIEPWMMEIEDSLNSVIQGTEENVQLQQPQQPTQAPINPAQNG